ncbi:class I lanthipeptide [Corallibacter sp.]|uniref:class I lanthipeptide n=1 Tax=Corallibacter sp. TaxID=2038084 RepID=UPI003AB7CECB
MKTKNNNKLVFVKSSVTELDNQALNEVKGGTTTMTIGTTSTIIVFTILKDQN